MKSWLLHNIGLKLASFFLAMLIWLVVHTRLAENPASFPKMGKIIPSQIGP